MKSCTFLLKYPKVKAFLLCLSEKKNGLKKLKAGLYEMNIGSKKVLEKNGFKIEGKFKSELIFKNKRVDHYFFGKIL